jgi:hypothetical protein
MALSWNQTKGRMIQMKASLFKNIHDRILKNISDDDLSITLAK